MIILITIGLVVVGLCLVFLSVVTPWLAVDWWIEYIQNHTSIICTGLKNAVGMTVIATGILYLDFKLGKWTVKLIKNRNKPLGLE